MPPSEGFQPQGSFSTQSEFFYTWGDKPLNTGGQHDLNNAGIHWWVFPGFSE